MRERLLLLSCAAGYGGSERTIECLMPKLARQFETTVVVENDLHGDHLEQSALEEPFKVVRFPKGRRIWDILGTTLRTLHIVRMFEPDAILTNTNKAALIAALAAPFLPRKTRIVVFIRDFQWTRAAFIFRLLGRRARYYAPSEAIKALWPTSYGPIPCPIGIIPDSGFEPTGHATKPSSSRILLLGAVSRCKGVDVLVDALALARERSPALTLDVVGKAADVDHAAHLQDRIRHLGLEDAVTFHDHVSDVSAFFFDCMCVVSATIPKYGGPETFGRTIVEAWAHSRPVVATNCGGPAFLVKDGETGLLVEPGDARQLADAICRLAENPALQERLAQNGRCEYLEHYTIDAISSQLCAALLSENGSRN